MLSHVYRVTIFHVSAYFHLTLMAYVLRIQVKVALLFPANLPPPMVSHVTVQDDNSNYHSLSEIYYNFA